MQRTTTILSILIVSFVSVAFIFSCSKEEIQIDQIPFRELESSFYELADSTLEIAPAQLDLVKNKENNSLTIDQSFGEIEVGHIIWSSFDTERKDFIGRRVVAVMEQGMDYILTTEDATMLQAYSGFYFDSEKPNTIQVRDGSLYNLANFFSGNASLLDDLLGIIVGDIAPGVESEFDLMVSGDLHYTVIHPDTACEYFSDCELTNSKGKNGINNGAEKYFNIPKSEKRGIDELGFYTFRIKDFGIEKIGLKFTSSAATMDLANLEPGLKGLQTETLTNTLKGATHPNLKKKEGKDLIYVPTPLTLGPAATVYLTVAPLLEMKGNVSLFMGLNFSSTDKIDIVMGHAGFYEVLNNPIITNVDPFKILEMDVKLEQNGEPAEISDLFDSAEVSAQIGASATITFNGGFNVGISVGGGEPNKAGISAGIVLPIGFGFELSGEGVADFPIIPAEAEPNFFGSICATAEFGILDFIVFTDANFSIPGSDVFDYFVSITELSNIEPPKINLFDFAPDIETNNGKLCWESTCKFFAKSELEELSINSAIGSSLEFAVTLQNDLLPFQEYFIEIIVDDQRFDFPADPFEMGQRKKLLLEVTDFTTAQENLIRAKDFDIEFYIKDDQGAKECLASFSGESAGIFDASCLDDFWYHNPNIGARIWLLGPGQIATYFTESQAQTIVQNRLRDRVSTIAAIDNNIECVYPSGYIILNETITNSHESYVWYSDGSNPDGSPILGLLKISHTFEIDGQGASIPQYEFEESPINPDVAAVVL